MPIPSRTGRPAMVTMVSGMPRYPAKPKAQMTPKRITAMGSRRHRTLKKTRRIRIMIATAMALRVSIPPRR